MKIRFAAAAMFVAGLAAAAAAQVHIQAAGEHARAQAIAALEANPALVYNPGQLLVKFRGGAADGARAAARAQVAAATARTYSIVPGLELLTTTLPVEQAIVALRNNPAVEYAEFDHVVRTTVTPNDTYFSLQWGAHNTGQTINGDPGTAGADINAPEAWDIRTGDPNFVIAIIDTGTQYTHPDLAANMWVNPGEIPGNGLDDDGNGYIDDVRGWDFYGGDNDPMDESGHGTHTAGTVGAIGNNGTGVAGMMWQCKLMPLRFLGPQGGYTSDAVLAVQYAAGKGVKVSNNSWGGGGYNQALYDAINASKSVGHIFVASAGNGGFDQIGDNNDQFPQYPASYNLDNIIAVAATNNDDGRAGFSNYGLNSVDLGAPGVNIASTYPTNNYAWNSGTSMAAPHVAGVVALLYAHNPAWTYSQVCDRILSTTRPVSSLANITVTGGVLDAAAALTGATSPPVLQPPAAPGTPTLTKLGGGQVRVSWSDNSSNEDGFHIEREQKSGRNWVNGVQITVGANTTTFTDSPGSGQFRYRIRAFNAAGTSAWSAWKSIKS